MIVVAIAAGLLGWLLVRSIGRAVRQVLGASLENVRNANIDLSKTYTNEFVQ